MENLPEGFPLALPGNHPPVFPPSGPPQRLFQKLPAKSKVQQTCSHEIPGRTDSHRPSHRKLLWRAGGKTEYHSHHLGRSIVHRLRLHGSQDCENSADILEKYSGKGPTAAAEKFYAMIDWFDQTCVELDRYLTDKKLKQNTIILYLADNGWNGPHG
jgi:arylsulfatase A-like enzyme